MPGTAAAEGELVPLVLLEAHLHDVRLEVRGLPAGDDGRGALPALPPRRPLRRRGDDRSHAQERGARRHGRDDAIGALLPRREDGPARRPPPRGVVLRARGGAGPPRRHGRPRHRVRGRPRRAPGRGGRGGVVPQGGRRRPRARDAEPRRPPRRGPRRAARRGRGRAALRARGGARRREGAQNSVPRRCSRDSGWEHDETYRHRPRTTWLWRTSPARASPRTSARPRGSSGSRRRAATTSRRGTSARCGGA